MSCIFSYDKTCPTSVIFTITSAEGFGGTAQYFGIETRPVSEFRKLLSALNEGKGYILSFCNSNGNISIIVGRDKVLFCVGKYGIEGDGEINIICPISICKTAIEDLVKHRQSLDE